MSCRETEFQWKNFGFSGVSREKFYLWQWRVPPVLIIIYKILISAILISTLLYNIATYYSPIPWLAFTTYWTYTLLTTYHVVHTVVLLHHAMSSTCHTCLSRPSFEEHHRHFKEREENSHPTEETNLIVRNQQQNDDLPLHLIILWIVYSVLNAACPFVTCGFYILIATPENAFLPRELVVHALNTVIVLIDQMVSAIPVRLFHFTFPIIYGLVYYLFSILYWMADHKHVVYKILLDWNHPALPFGMLFVTSTVTVTFHCISYGIYRARSAIYNRLARGN
ncbi:protein rolling stone-like [Haliotis rubra]|uniref:protein rolling stone-like n=1 Tax=Haliotis rubra TaxID=36100 RepID=UPI001EE534C7|nr:protein rolling stone-like [Haliotis rubra]